MKKVQNIATTSLLLIILAPLFLAISLQWRQHNIQVKMKEELEVKTLRTITLKQNELSWIRMDREIQVGERLFDVKSVHINGDGTMSVTGLFDEEETSLVMQIQKNQQENNEQGTRMLTQFFQLWIATPAVHQTNEQIAINCEQHLFPKMESAPVSQFKQILTPPPQA